MRYKFFRWRWLRKNKTCKGFDEFKPTGTGVTIKRFSSLHETCLSVAEINSYLGEKIGYGWHISDLVIYDKPKELSGFEGLRKTKFGYEPIKLTRPPQSWCYVEALRGRAKEKEHEKG